MNALKFTFVLCSFFGCFIQAKAQSVEDRHTKFLRYAVPFLLINPDARTGGVGEVGTAIITGSNSLSTNPASTAFLNGSNLSFSYSPWFHSLANDINHLYFSSNFQVTEKQVVGASVRYFSLGQLEFSDETSQSLGNYYPSEFALDLTYAKRFGDSFSLGLTARYIYSDPTSADLSNTASQRTGNSFAADVSAYFENETNAFSLPSKLSFSLNISNLGSKINYGNKMQKEFLPTNLRIGSALTADIDSENSLIFGVDLTKLLVPTYDNANTYSDSLYYETSTVSGIFNSFSDAPNGMSEELQEISFSGGLEYSYRKQFFLRSGYVYEHPNKGYKRYLTAGTGFKYKDYQLDLAYVIANPVKNPLANTVRLSFSIEL